MLSTEIRPGTFDGIIGQEHIVTNIRQQSIMDQFFNVYILSGQFGSGKTTIAKIISLAANCEHKDNGNPCLKCSTCLSILNDTCIDCVELDGATHNGVDDVRSIIDECCHFSNVCKYKVFIIDEVHMLSKNAFNALLKTLESPPNHCIFILCTTEIYAIPETVRSRAAKYFFKRIPSHQIMNHLSNVSLTNNIEIDEDAIRLIAKYSYGSMRNALNMLDQCSVHNQLITAESVNNQIGIVNLSIAFDLLKSIFQKNQIQIIKTCNDIYDSSIDLGILLNDLLDILADTAVYHVSHDVQLINNTNDYILSIQNLVDICTLETVYHLSSELQQLKLIKDYSKSGFVVQFIKITNNLNVNYDELLSRISELEKRLQNQSSDGTIHYNSQCKTNPVDDIPSPDEEYYYEQYYDEEINNALDNISSLEETYCHETQEDDYENQESSNNTLDNYSSIDESSVDEYHNLDNSNNSSKEQDNASNYIDFSDPLWMMQSFSKSNSTTSLTNNEPLSNSNVSGSKDSDEVPFEEETNTKPVSENPNDNSNIPEGNTQVDYNTIAPDIENEIDSIDNSVIAEDNPFVTDNSNEIINTECEQELQILKSVPMLEAVLKSCTIVEEDNKLIIKTKVFPFISMLNKYIEVYKIKNIIVSKSN